MENRPKRRKHKDNPYKLSYGSNNEIYMINFVNNNVEQKIEISKDIFEAFDTFELEDISQLHKVDKYIDDRNVDGSEFMEIVLYNNNKFTAKNVEEIIEEKIRNEELYKAMSKLSVVQKRRIKMYYFEDLTLQEIADIEGCSVKNVYKSIELAKEKLKNILKNKI